MDSPNCFAFAQQKASNPPSLSSHASHSNCSHDLSPPSAPRFSSSFLLFFTSSHPLMPPFPARRAAASSPPRAAAQPPLPAPSVLAPSSPPLYSFPPSHHATLATTPPPSPSSTAASSSSPSRQSPRYTNQSTMDSWTEAQLRKMEAGGNDHLNAFLTARGNDRLNSNAAAAYRDRITALAEGRPWTDPPVVKETPVLPRRVPGHQHRA